MLNPIPLIEISSSSLLGNLLLVMLDHFVLLTKKCIWQELEMIYTH